MSDGPYRVGSIQQLTSSSALQTGMSDADTKKLRAALATKDAEIERLRARIAEMEEALGFIRGWTAKRDADGMTFSKQRLLIGIVDCHARKALEG